LPQLKVFSRKGQRVSLHIVRYVRGRNIDVLSPLREEGFEFLFSIPQTEN